MRRLLLILAVIPLLGVGEGIGEWRPPDAGPAAAGGDVYATVDANDLSSGSNTGGVQEAIDQLASSPGFGVVLVPNATITDPLHIRDHISLRGVGPGHIAVNGTGSMLTADFSAREFTGDDVSVEVDLDTISSTTTDYNGITISETGVAALQSKLILESAGANTISWTAIAGNEFEVGQYVRLEQFAADVPSGIGNDSGGPYEILEIQTTTNANDTLLISDPKNRLTATKSGIGGSNERVHGTILNADENWPALGTIDVSGTSAGDVPYIVRFRDDDGSNDCGWANCDNNDRHMIALEVFSGDATKLAIDDPNEFYASETATVDYVASPCMVWIGESIHGPTGEETGNLRNIDISGITFNGDGDNDGDGDAFCALYHQPDADHAGTYSAFTRSHIQFFRFGDGDGDFTGADHSRLDAGWVLQGTQSNDTGPNGTNDQDDQQRFHHDVCADVSKCYFINSVQAVGMHFTSIAGGDHGYRYMEIESGGPISVDGGDLVNDDETVDAESWFYIHSTAGQFSIENVRLESGAGTSIITETGYTFPLHIRNLVTFMQEQDREDCINHQGTAVMILRDSTFQRNNAAYECDIEAPNAFKAVESGSVCIDESNNSVTCADGAANLIENRNYVNASFEPRAVSATWGANNVATADVTGSELLHREPSQSSAGLSGGNEPLYGVIATFAAGGVAYPVIFSCIVPNDTGTGTLNLNLVAFEDSGDTSTEVLCTIGFNLATETEIIKQDTTCIVPTSTAPYNFGVQMTDGGSVALTGAAADPYCTASWLQLF